MTHKRLRWSGITLLTTLVAITSLTGATANRSQAATSTASVAGAAQQMTVLATTNPCWGRTGVLRRDNGARAFLDSLPGGYDYTWDQGWLIVWDRGTPYRAFWPDWNVFVCPQ